MLCDDPRCLGAVFSENLNYDRAARSPRHRSVESAWKRGPRILLMIQRRRGLRMNVCNGSVTVFYFKKWDSFIEKDLENWFIKRCIGVALVLFLLFHFCFLYLFFPSSNVNDHDRGRDKDDDNDDDGKYIDSSN